jgi:regulator of cell morphogenesis and NO signaling
MNLFYSEDKLFDLIETNYNLLPVINRFGIRPGFKDKTVSVVCAENGIHINFFLALLNTYNNPDYFPEDELLRFSPLLIVDYLKKTHIYYTNYLLPEMEVKLDRLIVGSSLMNQDLKMIRTFYAKYKKEFLDHIRNEEEKLFPHIFLLMEDKKNVKDESFLSSVESEHSNMEAELNDLKSLLLKYLKPDYLDHDFNEFIAALYQFEKDLADHSRIEDKILMTQVRKIARLQK